MWPYMEEGVINMLTKLFDNTSKEVIKTDEYFQDALAASEEELEESNTSNISFSSPEKQVFANKNRMSSAFSDVEIKFL